MTVIDKAAFQSTKQANGESRSIDIDRAVGRYAGLQNVFKAASNGFMAA